MNMKRLICGASATLALAMATFAASAAPTTQLGFLIDASGSIGSGDFATMRSGYAAALAALPTDGSIEVTIYTFSTGTAQIVAPTVVTAGSLAGIVAAVSGMTYTGGSTHTSTGIRDITDAMVGSVNYSPSLRSIINMATDGVPNGGVGTGSSQEKAVAAAVASKAAGIDALTAEAINMTSTAANALRDIVFSPLAGPCADCGVVLADGSVPPNPMTSLPWILTVNDFKDFPTAIKAKVEAITVTRVPEPGALPLVVLAIGAAGFAARRARKA
jgi:von Willebrand factor type A domain/PEP-CTERM motif